MISYAMWNFGPDKSVVFKLLTPALGIAIWGTFLFWGFSLLVALVTQVPLIFVHRQIAPLDFKAHLAITVGLGILLFWFLFPFPMAPAQGGWSRNADGGLLAPLLLGVGGGVGVALLWYWLVFSKLFHRV
ncbi:MAG: hypothetical protein ABIR51_05590 [Sphingomicrobium sp.]